MLPILDSARKRRPLRRKSCVACIRAKRRCDPGQLACTRCTKQGLDCQYFSPPSALNEDGLSGGYTEAIGGTESSQLSFPLDVETRSCEVVEFTLDQTLDPRPFDMFSALNEDVFNHSLEVTRFSQLPSPILPTLPLPVDQGLSELPTFSASRLNYGISELKMAPSRMVLENQTPWSHPLLYEDKMPASMHGRQDTIIS
jgi:hypothetical protein